MMHYLFASLIFWFDLLLLFVLYFRFLFNVQYRLGKKHMLLKQEIKVINVCKVEIIILFLIFLLTFFNCKDN